MRTRPGLGIDVHSRNSRIDLLRGVSIMVVLLLHFTLAFGIRNSPFALILGLDGSRALIFNGNYGVTLFFVISGYLITSMSVARWGGLEKINLLAFYSYRFARIMPSLIVVLGVIVPLGCMGVPYFTNTDGGHHLPASYFIVAVASILTFWHNFLMQSQGWFNYCLNVYWSLSVEEVFYLLLPISCLLFRRTKLFAIGCFALIVYAPIYRSLHFDDALYWECGDPACFDAIAIGCLTALLTRQWRPAGPNARSLRILAVVGIALTYLEGIDGHEIFGFTVLALFGAMYLAASSNGTTSSGLTARLEWPVQWLGRHSYELYLFHIVILALMRNVFARGELQPMRWALWFALFMFLSIVVARYIARYVSEPANVAIRERFSSWQDRREGTRVPVTPMI